MSGSLPETVMFSTASTRCTTPLDLLAPPAKSTAVSDDQGGRQQLLRAKPPPPPNFPPPPLPNPSCHSREPQVARVTVAECVPPSPLRDTPPPPPPRFSPARNFTPLPSPRAPVSGWTQGGFLGSEGGDPREAFARRSCWRRSRVEKEMREQETFFPQISPMSR